MGASIAALRLRLFASNPTFQSPDLGRRPGLA